MASDGSKSHVEESGSCSQTEYRIFETDVGTDSGDAWVSKLRIPSITSIRTNMSLKQTVIKFVYPVMYGIIPYLCKYECLVSEPYSTTISIDSRRANTNLFKEVW